MSHGSRRAFALVVAVFHLLATSLVTMPAHAQDVDRDAPSIVFEALAQGRLGDRQVFSASVTDDVGIASVNLHYRFTADGIYDVVPMTPLSGTDVHTASLDDIPEGVTTIQYYIEARDASDNRTVQGFAFDPLERELVEGAAPIVASGETAAEPATSGISTQRKVLYGVLGVLAVGALASLAGGSDSGGGSGPRADDPSDVRVRFVVQPIAP